eukprot:1090128-Pyramimonas_sp.AAC.1
MQPAASSAADAFGHFGKAHSNGNSDTRPAANSAADDFGHFSEAAGNGEDGEGSSAQLPQLSVTIVGEPFVGNVVIAAGRAPGGTLPPSNIPQYPVRAQYGYVP